MKLDEKNKILTHQDEKSDFSGDIDDLIFRDEEWYESDR